MSSQIRVAVPTPGTLEVIAENFGDFISTFSDRLSRDGVLIPETLDLPRGSEVSLKFRLSDGFSLVEAIGLVSEPKAVGLGVHFLVIQSGGELVDKVVNDHLASGGQPFLVDSAAAATDVPKKVAAVPAPAPEPEAASEATESEESVRDLLVDSTKPAFAPGMVRLDGEGAQEREALSGLGSIDTQSKPLDGFGEESSMTQKIPIPDQEDVKFQTDGEAQSELEAAVRAMEPSSPEPSSPEPSSPEPPSPEPSSPEPSSPEPSSPEPPSPEPSSLEPPLPEPSSPEPGQQSGGPEDRTLDSAPVPPIKEPEPADLSHLSDEEFASEIDGALDSAFGSEVDAALDAAFGPTEPASIGGSVNLAEPSGLGDVASEALDASTRMVRIPDLSEPAPEGHDATLGGASNALDSAAAAAADLLGGEESAADDDSAAHELEGLADSFGSSGLDDSSAEFPSDAELTPIPAPELEELVLPDFSATGTEEPAVQAPESPQLPKEQDLPAESPSWAAVDTSAPLGAEFGDPALDEGNEVEEVSEALSSGFAASTDSVQEAALASAETPSQLEMPSFDQVEKHDPLGFGEPAPSRRGSRSGLIPLLLLALIGVGAWQVVDLIRKEFARLEPDPEVVARVALEDEEELGEAAFDSLLSLGKQEDGPVVDVDGQAAMAPVAVLENVTWESVDGGTRIVFAGDGAFSPMDTRVTRLEGESPRIVLKIGGILSAYPLDVLPIRTDQVSQLRFGFHPLPLRNEVHAVLDLVDTEAILREAKFAPGRLEVFIK